MGFLDKIKQQATDVASTVAEKTQETAKAGQLQMQLRGLKGEEKDAYADFGRQAYGLHRDGALAERSGELRELRTAEQHHDDGEDNQQLWGSETEHGTP